MQYRKDKYGNDLSVLGYGCMRFSQKAGRPDIDKTEKEILTAIELGVNYFDTAYIYPGSEVTLGEILARNRMRDKVNIATKLPHYMLSSLEKAEKYFQEELRRLQTDHIDYYLMHMLNDVRSWERLKGLGIDTWLKEKVSEGSIRQIGFSYHGNSDMFCTLLDAFDWDFCQIQYNYMDENSQAGKTGLHHAASKGIPVVIMEPLRGGKLVNGLSDQTRKLFAEYPVQRTPAEWSFRWLWNQPEVTVVLSGMNSEQMVRENAASAGNALPGCMDERDQEFLQKVLASINEKMKVGCTGCRYCMPCPHGVDIPGTFSAYNRKYTDSSMSALREYVMCTLMRKDSTSASHCVGCGKCEKHCPQHIPIRKELANARRALEGPVYKVASKVVPIVIKY